MKRRHLFLVMLLVIFVLGIAVGPDIFRFGYYESADSDEDTGPFSPTLECGYAVSAGDYEFSGPYTHQNLTIFLVHGQSTLGDKDFLTLQEALKNKQVAVRETGTVSELSIENLSTSSDVFVQSGDIVKGGKQDRTFPYDFIAPPQSGPLAINSFCVEQGRWSQRQEEPSGYFSSSSSSLSSGGLRIASRSGKSSKRQTEVWRNVSELQTRLEKKLGSSARSVDSSTSLQLTLENPKLQSAIAPYRGALGGVLKNQENVIGIAVVMNGKIWSADIYASHVLFRKLWPKLLESSSVEAFIEFQPQKAYQSLDAEAVRAFLLEGEQGEPVSEAVTSRIYVRERKAADQVQFDTCDRNRSNMVIHRSVIRK